jgi:hypothetical protein
MARIRLVRLLTNFEPHKHPDVNAADFNELTDAEKTHFY